MGPTRQSAASDEAACVALASLQEPIPLWACSVAAVASLEEWPTTRVYLSVPCAVTTPADAFQAQAGRELGPTTSCQQCGWGPPTTQADCATHSAQK